MKLNFRLIVLALALMCCSLCEQGAVAVEPPALEWNKQLGTSSSDTSYSVSADSFGGVYISGITSGGLWGENAGGTDAFVARYDENGDHLWTRQLGTSGDEESYGVSADGLGGVYVSGTTSGNLAGTNFGEEDALLSKYDESGDLLWSRQFGTSSKDQSYGVSADGLGSVYITGATYGTLGEINAGGEDAFISKFDQKGDLVWTQQFGSSNTDYSLGVSADGLGNVYTSGVTYGDLGGPSSGFADGFLSKFDQTGALIWTRQIGTRHDDRAVAISTDALGNVFVSGFTSGRIEGTGPIVGFRDAFVCMFDANGDQHWCRQFGTGFYDDRAYGVSADGLGNVYVSGQTRGSLGGDSAGGADAFVSKFDSSGELHWVEQFGTSGVDWSYDVSADGLGNIFLTGLSDGSLGGPNVGLQDAFVSKYSDPVPEPTSLLLTVLAVCGACLARRRG